MHTHYSEGGYNVTLGGDSNLMDDPSAVAKHDKICKSEYFRNLQRELQKEESIQRKQKNCAEEIL